MDLFQNAASLDPGLTPLASRIRPKKIEDLKGQNLILGKKSFLVKAIEADNLPSLILWGPPGTGKTTLAEIISRQTRAAFSSMSAVNGTLKELRIITLKASETRSAFQRKTILFIDEIHRFNKAQQDALLPAVETGIVTLIGATTENPSFSIISALLSRCRVIKFSPLEERDIKKIIKRALNLSGVGFGDLSIKISDRALDFITSQAGGDARCALNSFEMAVKHALEQKKNVVSLAVAEEAVQEKALAYDRNGEEHYNLISAFIKSLRGSSPDAALYWMFRIIDGGEDPLFILRRMIIFASEDIGNADPHALMMAVSALDAYKNIGMPEGAYPLAQACTYLACAPKSNAQVEAINGPRRDIKLHGNLVVPKKIRNAPTKLMKEWGYGNKYRYPHNEGGYAAGETYLPCELAGKKYYKPTDSGIEKRIKQSMIERKQKDSVRNEEKTKNEKNS